jgi:hypothetical protein
MLRVARIVPEFWARTVPESRVTLCAKRDKEFLTCGVFYLFDCCTNVIVRSGSEQPRAKTQRTPRRAQSQKETADEPSPASGCALGRNQRRIERRGSFDRRYGV